MGTVSSITSYEEWERFFDYIYGDESGWVYSPTKDPESGSFQKYHFMWPTEKAAFFRHLEIHSSTKEVYYGPALYTGRGAEKSDFKGSSVVWCEFDGSAPDSSDTIPEPTLKIQSSTSGHEHWYWKLDGFITDIDIIEDISRRIAYHLGADTGCWNGNRVLRPVDTKHHESDLYVKILRWDERSTGLSDFVGLPEFPSKIVLENDIHFIPQAFDVVAKYPWPTEAMELFKADIVKPGRSAALAKLGHYCIEVGTTNAEALSLLYHADDRWGKYKRREDRKKTLLDIINYCRAKHPQNPVEEELKPQLKVYTFEEFKNSDFELKWLVPELLHEKGLFMIGGPPAVGKSQVSLRFAEKMAKMEPFLLWKSSRPIKTMFVSMEMPAEELKYFLNIMDMGDKDGLLRENFLIVPLGYSIGGLKNPAAQAMLNEAMEKHRPDIVMMDSLGTAIHDELTSDKVIINSFDYVNKMLRNHFGAAVWFIHHPRKEQIGNKKPNKLDDLYGNRYITTAVTSAINLWKGSTGIEVNCLKMRMIKEFDEFVAKRTGNLDFEIIGHGKNSSNVNIVKESNNETYAGNIPGKAGI